jgi:hypothetical protein
MMIWLIQSLAAYWRRSLSEEDVAEVWGPANCRLRAVEARNGWLSEHAGEVVYRRSARCTPELCLPADGSLLARADTLPRLKGIAEAPNAVLKHLWVDCPIFSEDVVRGPRPRIETARHYLEHFPLVQGPPEVTYRKLQVPKSGLHRSAKYKIEFVAPDGGCKFLGVDPDEMRERPLTEVPGFGFLLSDAAPATVVDWFLTDLMRIGGKLHLAGS